MILHFQPHGRRNYTTKSAKSPILTEDFYSCKKTKMFSRKFFENFLIFAQKMSQNLDCGYKLEPPRRVVLTSTHNLCF